MRPDSVPPGWHVVGSVMEIVHIFPVIEGEKEHHLCTGCWCHPQIIVESPKGIVWSHQRGM